MKLLSRKAASAELADYGYPVAVATLAKYACVGGGPPMVRFGRKPLYSRVDLLDWAAKRCVACRDTSDVSLKPSTVSEASHD